MTSTHLTHTPPVGEQTSHGQQPTSGEQTARTWAGPRWARAVPVRVVVQAVVLFATLIVTHGALFFFGDMLTNSRPLPTLLLGMAGAGLSLLVYGLLMRWTERRRPDEIARRGAAGGLLRGMAIGALAFSTVIGVIAACGDYRVVGTGPVSALATVAGLMAAAAVQEELIFRGVLFRLAEGRLGTFGAIALSTVAFGAIHLANADANLWGGISVALGAGIMLAAAYAATRTLWLPIGIHFAWNVAESGLYGTINSGSTSDSMISLLTGSMHGSAALTGGAFGPEAGAPGVLVCVVVSVALLVVAARRGRLRPARRSTRASADS